MGTDASSDATPSDLGAQGKLATHFSEAGVKIYFNPFQFTIEQNNEFIQRGWEPMPMQIPR